MSWTDDRDRCAAAGIPATVTFATKPQLARQMIERAAAAEVPFAWVAGDGVYGGNGPATTSGKPPKIRQHNDLRPEY
jgi:SRSO17 transposase